MALSKEILNGVKGLPMWASFDVNFVDIAFAWHSEQVPSALALAMLVMRGAGSCSFKRNLHHAEQGTTPRRRLPRPPARACFPSSCPKLSCFPTTLPRQARQPQHSSHEPEVAWCAVGFADSTPKSN